jgi:excisionase family DNA binding protein
MAQTETDAPAWLSVPEAAGRLRVNPRTLQRWITGGGVPTRMIGKRRMVSAEYVASLVDALPIELPEGLTVAQLNLIRHTIDAALRGLLDSTG